MIKKLFSSKIVKLTTSILSGILCIGCLSANNADAMNTQIHGKANSSNKIKERKEAAKPKKAEADTELIRFNSLNHICVGKLERNRYDDVIRTTGGHLYEFKSHDERYLKDKFTTLAAKKYLANKTYFSKSIDEYMVRRMVNRALDNLEDNRKGEGEYCFIVDVGGGRTLGSEGETVLQVNVRRGDVGRYCSSAYPIKCKSGETIEKTVINLN